MSSVRKVHSFPPSQPGLPPKLPSLAGQTKLRAGSCEEAAGSGCGVSHDMYGEDREPRADELLQGATLQVSWPASANSCLCLQHAWVLEHLTALLCVA